MRWLVIAALLSGCTDAYRPASMQEGCHYVSCGDMLDGHDGPRCIVIVDNRSVSNHPTGQEALNFIRANGLKTCAVAAP
jgi:hypothetical protein